VSLALPFVLVWLVPTLYWVGRRESHGPIDDWLHAAAYLSMGWLNFLLLFTLARDVTQAGAGLLGWQALHQLLATRGPALVLLATLAALLVGFVFAQTGPRVIRQTVAIAGLHPSLQGFCIAQISDLHVGPTIGRRYVEQVVKRTNELDAHLVVLTGDIVDGTVPRLTDDVEPLRGLRSVYGSIFILGNHDCYSGATEWIAHFKTMGMRVLLNDHWLLMHDEAKLLVGGVTDPALGGFVRDAVPRPDLAAAHHIDADFRLLLAHNPSLAPQAERAGFDLQLSGHTHAGQFFPWTIAVRMVHAPLVSGLSKLGKMWVYVSAGTGSWGPPIRLGTRTELTLIELRAV
jgi:predicted MPP superfamily phosphohydrolase